VRKEMIGNLSLENYYSELETQIGSILRALGPRLPPEVSRQVGHFLDVGEYGLAIQILTDSLIEQMKDISPSTYDAIARLAKRMDMEQEIALEHLERRVRRGPLTS